MTVMHLYVNIVKYNPTRLLLCWTTGNLKFYLKGLLLLRTFNFIRASLCNFRHIWTEDFILLFSPSLISILQDMLEIFKKMKMTPLFKGVTRTETWEECKVEGLPWGAHKRGIGRVISSRKLYLVLVSDSPICSHRYQMPGTYLTQQKLFFI